MPKIQNSTFSKPPRPRTQLDNWYGWKQHQADGVASDPTHEDIPKGKLSSKQMQKPNANK